MKPQELEAGTRGGLKVHRDGGAVKNPNERRDCNMKRGPEDGGKMSSIENERFRARCRGQLLFSALLMLTVVGAVFGAGTARAGVRIDQMFQPGSVYCRYHWYTNILLPGEAVAPYELHIDPVLPQTVQTYDGNSWQQWTVSDFWYISKVRRWVDGKGWVDPIWRPSVPLHFYDNGLRNYGCYVNTFGTGDFYDQPCLNAWTELGSSTPTWFRVDSYVLAPNYGISQWTYVPRSSGSSMVRCPP